MKPFVIEGDLCLEWGDCGNDGFLITDQDGNNFYMDDALAEYFKVGRNNGDRHIGNVRIIIERIE